MPSQLHLNKEFTAKENVHANILKKPSSTSEGATSNDETVQASNLSSAKESKEEKQTTRMGPLTFNLNPKLEEDKHVYLAAVDDQAKLMHWHYRLATWSSPSSSNLHLMARSLDDWPRSSLLPAQDASSLVPRPKSPGKDERPPLKCLWQQRQDNVLCQSNDFDASELHCPAEGNTPHQEMLYSSHHLRRPLFKIEVRPPDDQAHLQRNNRSQTSLRTLCRAARHPHPPLPLQQWTIF